MGGEFGQWREWSHDRSLDWHLLDEGPLHRAMQELVAALNRLYRAEPALYQRDFDPAGFEWIAADDVENSIYAFIRRGQAPEDTLVCLFNFTPVPRFDYHLGLPGERPRALGGGAEHRRRRVRRQQPRQPGRAGGAAGGLARPAGVGLPDAAAAGGGVPEAGAP